MTTQSKGQQVWNAKRDRAAVCVKACRGIHDPEITIQKAREALHDMLMIVLEHLPQDKKDIFRQNIENAHRTGELLRGPQ